MMHTRYFILLMVLALLSPAAQADTIHLKNGSVLKGKVASFADDQFIIMLDTGSGRYLSRAMVFVGDVARIEFENAPAGASDSAALDPSPAPHANDAVPIRDAAPSRPSESASGRDRDTAARDTSVRDTGARDTARDTTRDTARPTVLPDIPHNAQPERQTPDADTSEAQSARQPDAAPSERPQPEKPAEAKATRSFDRPADSDKSAADAPPPEIERPTARKLTGLVRTTAIDVIGKRDWTSTGMIVKRGDRIRINASGSVTIDPVSGRTSAPEGTSDLTDAKKLMADQPTGALIGVIGADNDDFIFIGRSSEFTATRDGLLFLSVNEGNLADNVGTFKAIIEVQSQRRQ
jgi:hypothetical protein